MFLVGSVFHVVFTWNKHTIFVKFAQLIITIKNNNFEIRFIHKMKKRGRIIIFKSSTVIDKKKRRNAINLSFER